MSTRTTVLVALALLAGCPGGSKPKPVEPHGGGDTDGETVEGKPVEPDEPAPQLRTLDADTTITTGSGATFTASSGWQIEERADRITLVTPENDVTLVLVELKAAD